MKIWWPESARPILELAASPAASELNLVERVGRARAAAHQDWFQYANGIRALFKEVVA